MNALSKLTILSGSLALALAVTACNDDEVDSDGNFGGSGGSGGSVGPGTGGLSGVGGYPGGAGEGGGGAGGGSNRAFEALSDDPNYSYFVDAIVKAELQSEVNASGVTVLAPENDAFEDLLDDLDVDSLDELTAGQLAPIVRYHLIDAELDAEALLEFAPGDEKKASLGGTLDVSALGEALSIDGAGVIDADIRVDNGIIHGIDAVLLPSITDIVSTDPRFEGLAGLVSAADAGSGAPKVGATLDASSGLGGWLFFAPNNAAVDGLTNVPENQALTNVLLYHAVGQLTVSTYTDALAFVDQSVSTEFGGHSIVIDGGTEVTVTDETSQTATVVAYDIYAENGIIHVIDGVLLPD